MKRGRVRFFFQVLMLLMAGIVVGFAPQTAHAKAPKYVPVPFTNPYHDGYVWVLWDVSTSDAQLSSMLDRISTTGARNIVIPAFGCQSTITSHDVGACSIDTRQFALRMGLQAKTRGYDVTFLPIIVTPQWDWRGLFEPDDVNAWFASYTAWMQEFIQMVSGLGIHELVVASEFKLLYKNTAQWRTYLSTIRKSFAGPMIVTVNWDTLDYGFWDSADAIGISTYFPLATDANPAQDELDAAWAKLHAQILKVAKKYSLPVYMTEVGYSSSSSAASTPWQATPTAVDPDLQARCFTAFSHAWAGDKTLVRANVWATSDPADPNFASGFDPIGKPSEAVLHGFFDLRAALTNPILR